MLFHYARVSTTDQNLDRQIQEVECDRLYCDKQSGKNVNREQLQAMLSNLREGDKISCLSMDRLSRSLTDLINLVKEITSKGATISFEKEHLTFTPDRNDPFLTSFLYKIDLWLQASKALSFEKERKKKLSKEQINEIKIKMADRNTNATALAQEYKISRCLLYQVLKS